MYFHIIAHAKSFQIAQISLEIRTWNTYLRAVAYKNHFTPRKKCGKSSGGKNKMSLL